MEEDTGKTIHVGGGGRIHDADHSLVDYNRAGVPLMEIVSRPDIRSAEQAKRYVNELRGVLQAIGVSDVKMEEGSMRIDANVSVRPRGATELGTKVEIKNMNSIRSLGRALEYEIERQSDVAGAGERDRAGDPPLGRGRRRHPLDAHEGGVGRLPLLPRARPRARWRPTARCANDVGPGCRSCRRPAGPPRRASGGSASTRRGAARHARARRVRRGGGRGAEARHAEGRRQLVHRRGARVPERDGLVAGALPLAPDGLAELVGLVADGTLSRNLAKDVLDECLREAEAAEAGRRGARARAGERRR